MILQSDLLVRTVCPSGVDWATQRRYTSRSNFRTRAPKPTHENCAATRNIIFCIPVECVSWKLMYIKIGTFNLSCTIMGRYKTLLNTEQKGLVESARYMVRCLDTTQCKVLDMTEQ